MNGSTSAAIEVDQPLQARDCLLTKLPKEITEQILKHVVTRVTFHYLGPWRTYMKEKEHQNMTWEIHLLAGYLVPNLFLISKTILSKSEVVDAIMRFGSIKLRYQDSINYLGNQMSTEQKDIVKKLIVEDDSITSQDLVKKIGRHMIYRKHHDREYRLHIPNKLLTEKRSEGFHFLELDDPAKLTLIPGKRSERIFLKELVAQQYRWPQVDYLIACKSRLKTKRKDLFLNNDLFEITFSTKDWIIHGWTDCMELELPQTLTKKFFEEQVGKDGELRDSGIDIDRWIAANKHA